MGVHDGHRKRMKEQFALHGLKGFSDVNALELLLFYVLPRQNTNLIAHALIENFGSLDKVLEASPEELQKIEGVGSETASFLKLIPEISRRSEIVKSQRSEKLNTSTETAAYIKPFFMYEREEVLYMLCLDAGCRVLSCRELSRGGVGSLEISTRRVVEQALRHNAALIILAHNHVSGILQASIEDRETTKELAAALKAVDVKLIDHIIIAGDEQLSMADQGLI